MIRVLLVDDDPVFRGLLARALRSSDDLQVVGEAADGQEAVTRARMLRPDVVVTDIAMPWLDGVAAARIIANELPTTRVLMLTADPGLGIEAPDSGGPRMLYKGQPAAEILAAIRRSIGAPALASDEQGVTLYPVEIALEGHRGHWRITRVKYILPHPGGPLLERLTEDDNALAIFEDAINEAARVRHDQFSKVPAQIMRDPDTDLLIVRWLCDTTDFAELMAQVEALHDAVEHVLEAMR